MVIIPYIGDKKYKRFYFLFCSIFLSLLLGICNCSHTGLLYMW